MIREDSFLAMMINLKEQKELIKIGLGSLRCRTPLRQEEEGLGRKPGFTFVAHANREHGNGSSLGCNGL